MFLCFSEESQWEIHLIQWEIQSMGNSARATSIRPFYRCVVYDNRKHACNENNCVCSANTGFHHKPTPVVSDPAFNLPSLLDKLCCFVCVYSHVVLNPHI